MTETRSAPHQCLRLLLAEDEWLIVERIERALIGSRYTIAAKTPSLDEAMRLAGTVPFDAAILDGNLDGERTIGLADRLRLARVPFLLLTAYGSEPIRTIVAPVVTKPFAGVALLAALDLLTTDQKPLDRGPLGV